MERFDKKGPGSMHRADDGSWVGFEDSEGRIIPFGPPPPMIVGQPNTHQPHYPLTNYPIKGITKAAGTGSVLKDSLYDWLVNGKHGTKPLRRMQLCLIEIWKSIYKEPERRVCGTVFRNSKIHLFTEAINAAHSKAYWDCFLYGQGSMPSPSRIMKQVELDLKFKNGSRWFINTEPVTDVKGISIFSSVIPQETYFQAGRQFGKTNLSNKLRITEAQILAAKYPIRQYLEGVIKNDFLAVEDYRFINEMEEVLKVKYPENNTLWPFYKQMNDNLQADPIKDSIDALANIEIKLHVGKKEEEENQ